MKMTISNGVSVVDDRAVQGRADLCNEHQNECAQPPTACREAQADLAIALRPIIKDDSD